MSNSNNTAVVVAPYHGWVGHFWPEQCNEKLEDISQGLKIIDWTIAGLKQAGLDNISIICHATQVDQLKDTGKYNLVISNELDLVEVIANTFKHHGGDILYVYPWVIFQGTFCNKLMSVKDSDLSLAVNMDWQKDSEERDYRFKVSTEKVSVVGENVVGAGRFLDRSDWHSSFSGVAYIKKKAADKIYEYIQSIKNHPSSFTFHDSLKLSEVKFTDLIQELIDDGFTISSEVSHDEVLSLHNFKQLSTFLFGTKAQTLERLSFVLDKSSIADFIIFTVGQWKNNSSELLDAICEKFNGDYVVVRSSSTVEDGWDESLAGAFYSALNVDVSNAKELSGAISDVIDSYAKAPDLAQSAIDSHQVLIQTHVKNIAISGVLFTRDLHSGTPYYVINYDSDTGRTDSVTSGDTNNLRTLILYRDIDDNLIDKKFKKLISSCKEIEQAMRCDSLDIEFAITKDETVHIFQVRPMAVANSWKKIDYSLFDPFLSSIGEFVKSSSNPNQTTIFSNMADWNPAEMISTSPSSLALSLYEYLITDSTWRLSRSECGYSDLPSKRLMVSFAGKPYINVRNSFYSLTPKNIPQELRAKLVDIWIDELAQQPDLHDKVEFEIVPTCYTFNIENETKSLLSSDLTNEECSQFKSELLKLTDDHIMQKNISISDELSKVDQFVNRINIFENSTSNLTEIIKLLDDCRDKGVLPFSNLARMAFIGTSFLRSLVHLKVLDEKDQEHLKGSIHTITSEIVDDIIHLTSKNLDLKVFMKKYGHLRPGSYDINSFRYDENPDFYLHSSGDFPESKKPTTFILTQEQRQKITALLHQHGFTSSCDQLISFIKDSIRGRENAKFGFTKGLSLVLKKLELLGKDLEISRSDMAFVDIHDLFRWNSKTSIKTFSQWLGLHIQENKLMYQYTQVINLPDIITDYKDIQSFYLIQSKPNFVTRRKIISEKVILSDDDNQEIENKIVFIESSDPGFDWIFAQNIAGLITMYGGANSHMAIRCAEFGIPAAIGCGQKIYESLADRKVIELDCAGEIVRACVAH
jgi:glutamine kinase